MLFYRDLYVSPNIEHPWIVRHQLEHGKGDIFTYVLTLCDECMTKDQPENTASAPSDCGTGQLQFFLSIILKESYAREHCPMIIGIAKGHREMMKIVQEIAEAANQPEYGGSIVHYLAAHDERIVEKR